MAGGVVARRRVGGSDGGRGGGEGGGGGGGGGEGPDGHVALLPPVVGPQPGGLLLKQPDPARIEVTGQALQVKTR